MPVAACPACGRPFAPAPPEQIVHHLRHGVAPCGIRGVPADWPVGNVWSARWFEVTCPRCLELRPTSQGGPR
jgi:hypothetical protein